MRKKAHFQKVETRVSELRAAINQLLWYHNRVLKGGQRLHQNSMQSVQARGTILEMYCNYFQFGAKRMEDEKQQVAFLNYNLTPDFCLDNEQLGSGFNVLLEQWKRYSILHDRLSCRKLRIEKISNDGRVFRLTSRMELAITNATILGIYPHMLHDRVFLKKVIGQVLTYELHQTVYFADTNQIQYICWEHDLPTAWTRLLKDPKLTNLLLQMSLMEGAYVTTDTDDAYTLAKDAMISCISTPSP